jgi:hypothetical protein
VSKASPDGDAQLVEGIRRHLDEDAAGLDDATVSRLKQARQMALAVAARGQHPRRRGSRPVGDWLVPAGAFASIVATAIALTLMVSEPGNGVAREVDDLELLTAGEEFELYENLEFYLWLPDREQTG